MLDAEGQELYNRLKDKYSSYTTSAGLEDPREYDEDRIKEMAQAVVPLGTSAGEVTSSTGKPGQNVDVKLCMLCKGTGTQVEIYNHRRLEKFCSPCNGKGVNVYKNGVEVPDAPEQPSSDAAAGGEKADWEQTGLERKNKLKAEIAQIDQKLESYSQERDAVAASSAGSESDLEGQRLRLDLVQKLGVQIEKLSKLRASKAERLHRLQNPQASEAAES